MTRLISFLLLTLPLAVSAAPACRTVAMDLAQRHRVDGKELETLLVSLTRSQRLPDTFVTKRVAREHGWEPGKDLWRSLPGHSIGGDRFGNREGRLPSGRWYEADLDYKGGKRNAKRLVFTREGQHYLTVNHYDSFIRIRECQP
ncbi:ribonuclease domain-containing protein [Chitinibacteraceae bacterium HSL-7]